jgi:hypothetical protein
MSTTKVFANKLGSVKIPKNCSHLEDLLIVVLVKGTYSQDLKRITTGAMQTITKVNLSLKFILL